MNLQQQILTAFYMLLVGGLLGFVFDWLRVLARRFPVVRTLFWALDVIYWISAALLIFYLSYLSSGGQFRVYMFLFVLLGGFIYFRLLSALMSKFMVWLTHVLEMVFGVCIWPFKWLFIKPLRRVLAVIVRLAKWGWNRSCLRRNNQQAKTK